MKRNRTYRNFWDLVFFKAFARLRIEVSKYYLSFIWWVLEPVLTMIVFYIVFGILLKTRTPDFISFILIGLMSWNWFAKSVEGTANSILDGAGLMMLVNIPKTFFPLERLLQDLIKELIVVVTTLGFLWIYRGEIFITWSVLPVLMAIQLILTVGVSFLFSAIVPFLPDFRFMIATGVRLTFFASGIFYDIEKLVSPKLHAVLYMNPMAGLITAYRDILLYARWPDWMYLLKVFGVATVLLIASTWLIFSLNYVYPKICQQ